MMCSSVALKNGELLEDNYQVAYRLNILNGQFTLFRAV